MCLTDHVEVHGALSAKVVYVYYEQPSYMYNISSTILHLVTRNTTPLTPFLMFILRASYIKIPR